jgi:hypothetical protein
VFFEHGNVASLFLASGNDANRHRFPPGGCNDGATRTIIDHRRYPGHSDQISAALLADDSSRGAQDQVGETSSATVSPSCTNSAMAAQRKYLCQIGFAQKAIITEGIFAFICVIAANGYREDWRK